MTRIYANCKQAINEIKRNIYEMGIDVWPDSYQNKKIGDDENYSTKELQCETFTIIDSNDKDDIVGKDLEWCKEEFIERISREDMNPGEAWKLRYDTWKQFQDKEGKQDYTYASRMKNQIDKVIAELKRNPDTRQAIIEIHNNEKDIDSMGGKKRIPCSMFYQLMIRKDGNNIKKLNIVYVMRSTDFYTHFKNDIWLACELRDYIAKEVLIKPGTFTMFASSLHMYKKDWEDGVY